MALKLRRITPPGEVDLPEPPPHVSEDDVPPPEPPPDEHGYVPPRRKQQDQKHDDEQASGEMLPPQDLEAEQAVLGSLLLSPDAILSVAPILVPEDFYRVAHQMIYRAALNLHERRIPLDIALLAGELENAGKLDDCGGWAYLTSLLNMTPTHLHAEHYARVVEGHAVRCRLISSGGRIASAAYDHTDPEEAIEEAQSILLRATARRGMQEASPIGELMSEFMREVEERRNGDIFASSDVDRGQPIPTGFYDLDALLGGLHPRDFLVLAARPGMGKTSLALALARFAVEHHVPTGFFSLEMGRDQVCLRLAAMETRLNVHALRLGHVDEDDWRYAQEAAERISALPLYVDDSPTLAINDLRIRAKRMQHQYGCRLFMVDYLQLIGGSTNSQRRYNREQEVAEVSRMFKAIAKETNAPVLVLSQLNRLVEHRKGQRPQLSDLRESGQIEQDADIVMFLYHDDEPGAMDEEVTEVIVAKHRNGPMGTCKLRWEKESTRFDNLAEGRGE